MKEKMAGKETKKRLFSGALALAMVVALMPISGLNVYAAPTYENLDIKRGGYDVDYKWIAGSSEVAVGDEIKNCTFVNQMSGNLHADKTSYVNVLGAKVSGKVVKIDGLDLYLCSASDHETKKTANDLCPTCDPDAAPTYENLDIKRGGYDVDYKWIAGSSEVAVGDEIKNCTFVNQMSGNLHADKTSYVNVLGAKVSGKVVKIDGLDLYLCSASDHETKKAANDLCPTCDPDAGTHTHGTWSYAVENTSTLKATCGNEGCDDTTYSVSLTLTASDANSSGGVTLTGTEAWTQVFGAENVPVVHYKGTNYAETTTVPTAPGVYTATITVGTGDSAVTAETTYTVYSNTYTLTVPATAEAAGAGFNAVGNVNVKGNIAGDKKIVVKASGSDNNTFKSTAVSTTVRYTIVKGNAAENTEIPETGLVFSQDEVNKETVTEAGTEKGTSVAVGIIVNEADYINADDGDYTTTVTWKASLSSASAE